MSSEEIIRSEGGPYPMNATLRNVFEEYRYSPLEPGELRLAPSSNSIDPNAERCFTETELAQKCPTLLYEKKPAPVQPTDTCPGYFPVDFGDGYVKDFGDTDDNGGFTPAIPSARIEEYQFPTAPSNKTLMTKGNTDTTIKQGTLVIKMIPRVAQAVQSIKWGGKEYLKTPMFTTAAVDVSTGVSDKAKRVGETNSVAKSTSKVVAVATSATSVFTRVQAAYSLPPGTILEGKRVSHTSTLSTTNITKNISIASNMVARYTAGVSLENPFVSGRFNIPMFTLTPEFKKIYVYRKSKHVWETPTQAQLTLDSKDVLAIIFTNTSQTHAMGVRTIAIPKPKKFGSTFNNKLTTNVVRSAAGVSVATTLTVGTRGGNANKVYAPAGIYTVVQDNIFGTFAYVHGLINKIYSNGGKCPPCKPIAPAKTHTVDGSVVKVISPNQIQIKYTKPDKKVVILKVTKSVHNMKLGEIINVILAFDAPYAFKAISKKAAPKPTPLPGSSCSTVSPNSRKACCKNKTLNGSVDKWCAANYPDIAPTPAPSKLCKDASNVENCCVEKALRGDFADFSCTPKKSINWLFWGGVILLLIALCIIGFFVYKRYFTSSGNISENNDNNFSNNNNNFSNNDNNFSNNNNNFNNNDNNFRNNFVADNLDKADLDILNMPAPPVKSSS